MVTIVLENRDERLRISLSESTAVLADNRITFRFKDSTEINVGAESAQNFLVEMLTML